MWELLMCGVTFTCLSYSCVEGHSCVEVTHICGTSHQNKILHSLIFFD